MFELSNITLQTSKFIILNKITVKIPLRSIIGIIGPNGAGKSTLLRIIAGFQPSYEGNIYLNKRPIKTFYEKQAIFSYMPEHIKIYPDYYVKDLISFIQTINRHPSKKLVQELGIANILNKKIRHLSKGYHQRLKLFIALNNKKNITILDEPFDGFDPIQLIDIISIIKNQKEAGKTFILSMHQLHLAETLCDFYLLLNEGKLIATGDISTLKKDYGDDKSSLEDIFIKAIA